MGWYRVIKTIKGRRYLYEQRTWREGKRVRTESRYIGPAEGGDAGVQEDKERELTLQGDTDAASKIAVDVDAAMAVVEGPPAEKWEHHWEERRYGKPLVVKHQRAEQMLRALGVRWTHRTRGAFYDPATGSVNIPPLRCFKNTEHQTASQAYYMVVFHEVTHWTAKRVDRNVGERFSPSDYAAEELVAELGAVMLMQQFGMTPGGGGRHALYFQVWRDRIPADDRTEAVERAKREAERAVRWVMEHGVNTTQDKEGVV